VIFVRLIVWRCVSQQLEHPPLPTSPDFVSSVVTQSSELLALVG
jgi:hypothetical protein